MQKISNEKKTFEMVISGFELLDHDWSKVRHVMCKNE